MIRCIVFVVLMMFWLFGGPVIGSMERPSPYLVFAANSLVPWAAVAVLGWAFFEKNPPSH